MFNVKPARKKQPFDSGSVKLLPSSNTAGNSNPPSACI